METLVISVPAKKSAFVKQLLTELGVSIEPKTIKTPNALTVKTIEDARKGKGLGKPIKNIKSFIDSL